MTEPIERLSNKSHCKVHLYPSRMERERQIRKDEDKERMNVQYRENDRGWNSKDEDKERQQRKYECAI